MEPNPKDIEPNFIETPPDGLNIVPAPGGSVIKGGTFQSPNFQEGVSGWKLSADGVLKAISAIFFSVSTLNIKSYTNFEATGRFTATVDGGAARTVGTSGLRLETSATATSSALNEWFVNQNVFFGSPTFSALIEWGSIPTIGGVGFIGLGATASFSGSGATFTGSHAGFQFQYQSGEWRLYASQNNGGTEKFSLLTTMASSDTFDLIIKVNGTTSVDYYYRKNSGSLVKTTITGGVPTATTNKIQFGVSNKGEANNIVCLVYSASYER